MIADKMNLPVGRSSRIFNGIKKKSIKLIIQLQGRRNSRRAKGIFPIRHLLGPGYSFAKEAEARKKKERERVRTALRIAL